MDPLCTPLLFTPIYQTLVWGGRRMAAWRDDLPSGTIGESWDLADHPRGMSVVASGALAGRSLAGLCQERGAELVGTGYTGGPFPLMIKLIDANDRLSVQVHPDDDLARTLGVGERGKTECWLLLSSGELFVGTRPGTTRESFAQAVCSGNVVGQLNRFSVTDGDFFFLPARTVHALGAGCLLYEVQQTCDVTFRVDDWGRVGLDGKPRPLHIPQSLETIDYSAQSAGPVSTPLLDHPEGGKRRQLASCPYFSVEEHVGPTSVGGGNGHCSIVVCLAGHGSVSTRAGAVSLQPMRTILVPACAGPWRAQATDLGAGGLRLLVARPV